jgi:hypothetical protein
MIRDQAANVPYKPGTPEGDDVVAAVASIERLAAALAPAKTVALGAYGSHSTTQGGLTSASFSVSVNNAN